MNGLFQCDCRSTTSQRFFVPRRAEPEFEFARLFREGCWGGDDAVCESKIAKLRRCQEIRPADFGVCLHIFRVCHYMNRLPEAANAMALYRPATQRDRHGWLLLVMQSHAAGGRWAEAETAAHEILTISPADSEALALLQRIERVRRGAGAWP